ncbi:MAG: SAM-dependent methyltransferase [Pseudomonadota bacterium]
MVAPDSLGPAFQTLARHIRRHGPITVANYMSQVLVGGEHGYYMGQNTGQSASQDPFGVTGDFTTAPEISQMFGELIGLWCVDCWQRLGCPRDLQLIELGPGRGTLMADALRAARLAPNFLQTLKLALVEVSPALRRKQEEKLAGLLPSQRIAWYESLGQVPEAPTFLIANEFLDALPIRQFEQTEDGWRERLIGLSPKGDELGFVQGPTDPLIGKLLSADQSIAEVGCIIESCAAAEAHVAEMAGRLREVPGAALFIDYGYVASSGQSSLQAVRRHSYHPVLAAPGSADLSAHVNFARLNKVAADKLAAGQDTVQIHGPTTQGTFLAQLGIRQRAERLMATATPDQASDIQSALDRLTAPDQMGDLFKVLAITSPQLQEVAGFGSVAN